MKNRIKELAHQYAPEFIAIRRHIHSHPELSFEEHETTKFLQQQLDAFGVKYTAGIAGTGIVAIIEGKNPAKKVIALRADIDALPITEANEVPYKSLNKGVMHACGHDAHTTILLGVAKVLNSIKDNLN